MAFSDLRILAGEYKRRVLLSPRQERTHPMGARERLALFNMIQTKLPRARVLDAYAGSGALGIEALSRGAAEAVFVERSPQVARVIQQNLENILSAAPFARAGEAIPYLEYLAPGAPIPQFNGELTAQQITARVYTVALERFVAQAGYGKDFDVILADPPYDNYEARMAQELTALLRTGGILVWSHPASEPAPELPGLYLLSDRSYAAAGIALYR